MIKRYLLVDLHAVLHNVKFSLGMGKTISRKEKNKFIISGFLIKLQYLMNRSKANYIVFAGDSEHNKRKTYFKGYKLKRQEKSKELQELDDLAFPQFTEVIEYVLPTIGYKNIHIAHGFEGDDVIARICKDYNQYQFIVVSEDKDLYQLLTNEVCMFKIKSNKFYSLFDFKKEYGINPIEWQKVKGYGGCGSDCVPGLPIPNSTKRIGEGLALQYVKGILPLHYKAHQAFIAKENKKILRRNIRLTKLPLRETPHFKIVHDAPSVKGLTEVCEKYNLRSILSDLRYWKRILNLR